MPSHIRTKTFVWVAEKQGWRPESTPQFNAGGSFLATHDTMEHFNDNPDFTHELLAFGSTIYDRVSRDFPEMWKNVTRDLIAFMRIQKYEIEKPTREWHAKIAPADEQYLNKIVGEATKASLKLDEDPVSRMIFLGGNMDDLFAEPYGKAKIVEAFRRAEQWIRLGWLVAHRRYHNHTRSEVRHAFAQLVDLINEDHEEHTPEDGERMTVTFNLDDLTFEIKHNPAAARQYRKAA